MCAQPVRYGKNLPFLLLSECTAAAGVCALQPRLLHTIRSAAGLWLPPSPCLQGAHSTCVPVRMLAGVLPWAAATHCAVGVWMHTFFHAGSARQPLDLSVIAAGGSGAAVLQQVSQSWVWRRITQLNGLPLLILLVVHMAIHVLIRCVCGVGCACAGACALQHSRSCMCQAQHPQHLCLCHVSGQRVAWAGCCSTLQAARHSSAALAAAVQAAAQRTSSSTRPRKRRTRQPCLAAVAAAPQPPLARTAGLAAAAAASCGWQACPHIGCRTCLATPTCLRATRCTRPSCSKHSGGCGFHTW